MQMEWLKWAKTLKTLQHLTRASSLCLSWFYRGHLEVTPYGSYFQVLLNLVIIVPSLATLSMLLKLLLTRQLKNRHCPTLLHLLFLLSSTYFSWKTLVPISLSLNPFLLARGIILGSHCSHHEPINVHSSGTLSSRLSNLLLCSLTFHRRIHSIRGHLGVFDLEISL